LRKTKVQIDWNILNFRIISRYFLQRLFFY